MPKPILRVGQLISRLVGRPSFWFIALAVGFIVPLSRAVALGWNAPSGPTLKMPLPEFRLTNERGEAYGSADLKGRVWVADFVFTTCPTACPKLTGEMQKIQHRGRNLGDAFHLVTFTVDPENDTPQVLAAYAERYHASPARWTFLTGKLGDLETTVVKGFKIAMGKEETSPASNIFSIFHGERLVLVDQGGNIRGYYDANEEGEDALLKDVGLVVNGR
jgi:protein SCO1/2